MMSEPRIEYRPEFFYVALRQDVAMSRLGAAVQHGFERVAKYLAAAGLAPSGPPFVRYVFIDMREKLTIETGFPLNGNHTPSDPSLAAGLAPSGDYVCGRHVGAPESLVAANAELQRWAASHGVALDVRSGDGGEHWAGRFEHSLLGPEAESNPGKWVTLLAYRVARSPGRAEPSSSRALDPD